MRSTYLSSALLTLSALASGSPADQKAAKAPAVVVAPAAGPRAGIKIPGVQIPFASLKAEATFPAPAKPFWAFFSGTPAAGSLLVPAQDRLDKIDTATNKTGEPLAGLNKPCGGMISAFGSLWLPLCGDGTLVRLDSKSFKVTATIPAGTAESRGTLASSGDSIWLLTDSRSTLSRIDPDQNIVVGELRVPSDCRSLTFGETALWLACPQSNKVFRINPATNVVEKTIEVSALPQALAIGEGSVWVFCAKDGKVDRIDPKTNKVSKSIDLGVPGSDGELAFGEGALWVTQTGFPLTRINVQTESVAQQFYGEGGGAIRLSAGAIWLSNFNNGTLSRIDPKRVLITLAE